MTHTPVAPFIHVEDNNGKPIVGAVLHVYEAGTTTYRPVYVDAALTTPMANPLSGSSSSNANGNFPCFYTAPGVYKLRAETSAGVLIWQFDNLDTGLSSSVGALPITLGGTGATTAAAARANLDVPSTSELTDLASDIATLSSSVQNIVSAPQGRLTLTTGTPVLSTGVSAGTAVYYTAFVGNVVPVYDGAQFTARTFSSDLTLTLNANHVAGAIYDNFIFWDGSALQIATGVAWNTATAGAGARGTGAGTTELVRVNGIWVNKYDISYRNGATTGTIPAYKGTFVGSISMDGTNGQVSCHTTYGQSRKWGVWNAYNRKPIILRAGDATSSWVYNAGTVRPSNNSSANSLTVFAGLPEEYVDVDFDQTALCGGLTLVGQIITGFTIGIGWNSTTAFSGKTGTVAFRLDSSSIDQQLTASASASYQAGPTIGINVLTCLESTPNSTNSTTTYQGTNPSMQMVARLMG